MRGGGVVDGAAQSGIRRRQVGQPVAQRLEVQHGAAGQQRDVAARDDLAHQADGIGAKTRGGVALLGRYDVDQVVRADRAFRPRGLGRADVHVAVHQRRVDADDLDRQGLRERKRTGSLATGGGTEQEQGGRERMGGGGQA